jgi:hypothetical protein
VAACYRGDDVRQLSTRRFAWLLVDSTRVLAQLQLALNPSVTAAAVPGAQFAQATSSGDARKSVSASMSLLQQQLAACITVRRVVACDVIEPLTV